MKKVLQLVAVAIMVGATGLANAALDTAVSTEITTAKADVLALGALVFAVAVGVKLYKWLRRAL